MSWNFEKIAGPFQGPTGGLAWDGSGMLFSAIAEGRILRYDPASGKSGVFRKYTNRTNGIAFAPDGALYGCKENSRRVIRFAEDGSTSTTAFLLGGAYHNQPNNLAIDSKGRIWFSDPQSELRASGPQIFPRRGAAAERSAGPRRADLSAAVPRLGTAPRARSLPQA